MSNTDIFDHIPTVPKEMTFTYTVQLHRALSMPANFPPVDRCIVLQNMEALFNSEELCAFTMLDVRSISKPLFFYSQPSAVFKGLLQTCVILKNSHILSGHTVYDKVITDRNTTFPAHV